jgi:Putative lumazine-binding
MLRGRRSSVAALLPPVLLLAALSGCGTVPTKSSTTFTGASAAVASTINSFHSAAQSRDTSKLCNQILAPALAAKLKDSGGGCTHVIDNQLKTVENYDLTIESITVNGNSAQARVKSISAGKSHFDTLLLTKVGNSWRLSGLG